MDELRNSRVLGGRDHHELIDYGVSAWRKVQDFEGFHGARSAAGRRGRTLVAVTIEPGDGEGGEGDAERWYREEHLSMLATFRQYVRGRRYRSLGGSDEGVKLLALHEWDCEPEGLPEEEI